MKYFNIGEWGTCRREWHQLLPDIPIVDVYDGLMTAVNKRITVDLVALGRRLEYLYPEEYERLSIAEMIIEHYGENAKKLIEKLL